MQRAIIRTTTPGASSSHEAVKVLTSKIEKNVIPDRKEFLKVLHSYSKVGDVKNAYFVLKSMKQNHVKPGIVGYSQVLDACSKSKPPDLETAMNVKNTMKINKIPFDKFCYTSLVALFSKRGEFNIAESYLNQMLAERIKPDAFIFNSLLNRVDFPTAKILFSRMFQESVKPDLHSFSSVIKLIIGKKDNVNLFKILDDIVKCNLIPNVTIMNQLLHHFAMKGNQAGIVLTMDRMKEFGILPDTISMNSCIYCHAMRGSSEQAISVYERMKNIPADLFTMNNILNAIAKDEKLDKDKKEISKLAEKWFGKISEMNLFPDIVSYSSLMSCYLREQNINKVVKVFETAIFEKKLKPTEQSFAILLNSLAQIGDFKNSQKYFDMLLSYNISQNVIMHNCVLDCLATNGDCAQIQIWYEKMVNSNIVLNVVSYNSLMESFAKQSDEAGVFKWFDEMVANNISPNVVTFNHCLHVCAKNGNVEEVKHWLKKMDDFGVTPSIANYNVVIDSLSQVNDYEGVKTVCEAMRERGIDANLITLNTAMTSFKFNEAADPDF
eukprot:gene50-2_t